MKMYTLTQHQQLPITSEEAWEYFSDPKNLEIITPDDMPFKILDTQSTPMYSGMILRFMIQPLAGFKVKWVTEITHVDKGKYFVDEQRFGPFKFWQHKHHFYEVEGGVELRDSIQYVMPFAFVGRLVHRFLVRKRLEAIFQFRKQQLEAYFGQIKK